MPPRDRGRRELPSWMKDTFMKTRQSRTVWSLGTVLLALLAQTSKAADKPADRCVLHSFDYRGVTLEGPLRQQVDAVRDYYLRLNNDDLLKGFRQRSGQPAPGNRLGGWYSDDVFHVFGQILSGLARMYAATGDPACKAKAEYLLAEWMRCIDQDGYFFYSRKPNAPHYIYDKMVGGLVDMHLYIGSQDALKALSRITNWAIAHLDRRNTYAFNAGEGPTEWYTLSENLDRAFLATGDSRYCDFARVWEYTTYWDLCARRADLFGKRPDGGQTRGYHAYSHVNTLGGAGAAFRVTGEQKYLDIITGAYDLLQSRECFATGGYGPDELLLGEADLAQHLQDTHNSFETQCGCWAGFKLCKHLIELTGNSASGDWVERLVINGLSASIPPTRDGRVFYYSDYNPSGATKRNHDTPWTCCTGTRPMAVADYHTQVYFHGADSLCVVLYTPSSVHWKVNESLVTVHQQTEFPRNDNSRFELTMSKPTEFALRLRFPGWLAEAMQIRLNGRIVPCVVDAGNWVTMRRLWNNGDRVEVKLPMALASNRFEPGRAEPTALMKGPVVLAVQTPEGRLPKRVLQDLLHALEPVPGEPLHYRIPGVPSALVRPFYEVGEGVPYFVSFDPGAPTRIGRGNITFQPKWNDGGRFAFTDVGGATASVAFEGTGIRWLGYRFDDGGRAEVKIDGQLASIVDQYGPGRDLPFDWHMDGLAPGHHTLKMTLLPDKSAASRGCYLNIAGFEVLGGQD